MTPWTEERVDRVKQLWQLGKSAAEIASTIGDCSRNAVIGLVHRRRWDGGSVPMPRGAARRTEPRRRDQPRSGGLGIKIANGTFGKPKATKPIRVAPRPREDVPLPESRALSIFDLNHFTCRWPDGAASDPARSDGGNATFGTKPYCEAHCRLAYVAPAHRNIENLARAV